MIKRIWLVDELKTQNHRSSFKLLTQDYRYIQIEYQKSSTGSAYRATNIKLQNVQIQISPS